VQIRIVAGYAVILASAILGVIIARLLAGPTILVASFTFLSVVGAALLIAWAAEASQFSISQGLALAIVAMVQTLPEFFVEGTIAWKAGQDPATWLPNVTANFTGANRLLTGLGWPLILFTAMVQRWKNGQGRSRKIRLEREQSVEVVFMIGATLYYLLIWVRGFLDLLDTLVLLGAFLAYLWMLSKLPSEDENPEEVLDGSPLAIVKIKRRGYQTGTIFGLFAFSGLVFVLISDPFVESIRRLAETLIGAGAVFFFIQWIAPFLSEFPEKVTAFHWARKIRLAPMALLNFVSSAVNELTALVAVIPIVFALSFGALQPVSLLTHRDEVLLTMAQSLYASSTLLDLEYDVRNALTLFGLWLLSTFFVETRFWISILFILLTVGEVAIHWGRITAFSSFQQTIREHLLRTYSD
jgi:cation:H+ antiporter